MGESVIYAAVLAMSYHLFWILYMVYFSAAAVFPYPLNPFFAMIWGPRLGQGLPPTKSAPFRLSRWRVSRGF